MTKKATYTLLALAILIGVGVIIWSFVWMMDADAETRETQNQCIRRGYVESMELWGIRWCVKIEEGRLVGVQGEN